MRRGALVALFAVAVLALALTAAVRGNRLAFTLGVASAGPAAMLEAHDRACQRGIVVPPDGGFDSVRLMLGTDFRLGPPVTVTVHDAAGGAAIARGRLPGGYPDIARAPSHGIRVGDVAEGRRITVCVENEGPNKVAVYGNAGAASGTTSATVRGEAVDTDLNLVFETRERSMLSLLPALAERAELFKAGWVGPWTFALLAGLVLVAVPALLVRAVAAAGRASP
jgi:hypothetical protein